MIFGLGPLLGRRRPEHPDLRIGFLPTLDAATLLVAQARGYFQAEGLSVQLSRLTSWQRGRQQLANRELDAAHLPGSVPLMAHLGIDDFPLPLRTSFVLSLGGSSFAVQTRLFEEMQAFLPAGESVAPSDSLKALATVVRARLDQGQPKLRFAVSDFHANGSYDLRYCLAAAGIDPECDVDVQPVTPTRVGKSLRGEHYDGAWLAEPFGTQAAQAGSVHLLFSKHAFWNHSLSKVLAVPERMVKQYPRTYAALLRSLLNATVWLEGHREEALELMASRHGLDQRADSLGAMVSGIDTLAGADPHDLAFDAGAPGFPWYSQAVWYLGQMIRWGDYDQVMDFKKTAQAVYLPKHYRDAARELSLPYPTIGYKTEGEHPGSWVLEEASEPIGMGADLFFDRRLYKPRQTMKYLNGLDISHISAPLDAMWAIR